MFNTLLQKTNRPFIAVLFLSVTTLAQKNYSPETLKKIQEVETNICGQLLLNDEKPSTITERMAKYKVKGMSIAVIHNYQIAWAKGYGWADEAEKRPVTTETLFEPGSISKSLNALGILKLAQDHQLDLYTDINTYLKSWKFPYDSLSKGKKITLAHLLSHTAGLSVHGFPGHDIKGPIPTLLQVLDGKAPSMTPAVRSLFEPGLKFKYSGGGTSISQILLTDIVNQPYETWMYENVLKPIGMEQSFYNQPPVAEKRNQCASAYTQNGDPLAGKFHVYPEQAAAGLWMTPSDLCRYIIEMQLAYAGKSAKVLNADMAKLHVTPYIDKNAAMGTFIEDHDGAIYFQHGAGNDGFCGQFYGSLTKGYGVAIFLNTDFPKLLPEVINSVAKVYEWDNFYTPPQRKKSIKVDDKTIARYEGIYITPDSWAGIGKKDNAYHFYANRTYANMHFTSPTCFFNEEFRAVKTFVKDDKGNVVGYTRMVDGKEFPKAIKLNAPDTAHLENEFFGEIGWYLFELKKLKESLAYFSRGVQLYPEDMNMLMNKAHLYLFNNEYDKARDIYKTHLEAMVTPGYSWRNLMKDDFIYFRDAKYDISLFEKVFAELKLEKP